MREILAAWIILQLFFTGYAVGSIHNEIAKGEYICPSGAKEISALSLAVFPILLFIPEHIGEESKEYCKKQILNEKQS